MDEEVREFWDAYWLNLPDRNILCIEHYKLERDNGKSYRYRVEEEEWVVENLKIVKVGRIVRNRSISKNKINDKSRFKTREDAIMHLISNCSEEMERCKRKLEYLPKILKILEEVKGKLDV